MDGARGRGRNLGFPSGERPLSDKPGGCRFGLGTDGRAEEGVCSEGHGCGVKGKCWGAVPLLISEVIG